MKKMIYILTVIMTVMTVVACSDDDKNEKSSKTGIVVTGYYESVGSHTAVITGSVTNLDYLAKDGVFVSFAYSKKNDLSDVSKFLNVDNITSVDPSVDTVDAEKIELNGTDFKVTLNNLEPKSKYHYRVYCKNDTTRLFAANTRSFITENEGNDTKLAVDMGLSVMWATCNLGADSQEENGNYYAWGEDKTKNLYGTDNYEWDGIFKDVVQSRWGDKWRMPTREEMQELIDLCKWTSGGNGYTVTGPSGKIISFPAAGYRENDYYRYDGGYYWTSSQDPTFSKCAHIVHFGSGNHYMTRMSRSVGLSVRPVCPK